MGARRRVKWTRQAKNALEEAVEYVAQDSPDSAVRIVQEAMELAASLDEMSKRGRIVPELRQENIREVFLHKFRLIYKVTDEEVLILAFLHGARDFHRWQGER